MDKAADTLVWQCPHAYYRKLRDDLKGESAGDKVYQLCTEPEQNILHRHALFITGHGLPAGATSQELPFYVRNPKLHKQPAGMRFISSSARSSIKVVSIWLNRLLRELLPDVDRLFADCAESMGMHQPWAQQSWILRNSAGMIPLIRAWNAGYAEKAPQQPCLEAYDFERLYTSIPLQDMEDSIMQLMTQVFEAGAARGYVAIKVRAKKHAF